MDIQTQGLKVPKTMVLDKSPNGKFANIAVSIFNPFRKREVLTTFSGCEVLANGRFRKDVSDRKIGLQYLYF